MPNVLDAQLRSLASVTKAFRRVIVPWTKCFDFHKIFICCTLTRELNANRVEMRSKSIEKRPLGSLVVDGKTILELILKK